MDNNNIQKIQDDKIKDLLSGSTLKASDNLKYRIMHQIEAEKALAPKKATASRFPLENMLSIFGIMYALIAVVGLVVYFTSGAESLLSAAFYIPALSIASICMMFWAISVFDDKRRSEHKNK